MKHEKIIKREDGSRVKIIAELFSPSYSTLEFRTFVQTCEKGKRTWKYSFDGDSYIYRSLSIDDRRKHDVESQRAIVSDDEILEAKLELWQKLKPAL